MSKFCLYANLLNLNLFSLEALVTKEDTIGNFFAFKF